MHQPGPHADLHAVDLDQVGLGIDAAAEHRDLAVDPHAPALDQLLTRSTAPQPRLGEHLLEADALVVSAHEGDAGGEPAPPVAGRHLRRAPGAKRRPEQASAQVVVVVEVDLVEADLRGLDRAAVGAGLELVEPFAEGRPGRGSQPGLEVLDHVGAGDELAERRELVEPVEAEPLEEQRRGAEQDRLARDRGPCRPR